MQPEGVILKYFKLGSFDLTVYKVYNIWIGKSGSIPLSRSRENIYYRGGGSLFFLKKYVFFSSLTSTDRVSVLIMTSLLFLNRPSSAAILDKGEMLTRSETDYPARYSVVKVRPSKKMRDKQL